MPAVERFRCTTWSFWISYYLYPKTIFQKFSFSGGMLRRALIKTFKRATGNNSLINLNEPVVVDICMTCDLFQTLATTFTQLRMSIVAGKSFFFTRSHVQFLLFPAFKHTEHWWSHISIILKTPEHLLLSKLMVAKDNNFAYDMPQRKYLNYRISNNIIY